MGKFAIIFKIVKTALISLALYFVKNFLSRLVIKVKKPA